MEDLFPARGRQQEGQGRPQLHDEVGSSMDDMRPHGPEAGFLDLGNFSCLGSETLSFVGPKLTKLQHD